MWKKSRGLNTFLMHGILACLLATNCLAQVASSIVFDMQCNLLVKNSVECPDEKANSGKIIISKVMYRTLTFIPHLYHGIVEYSILIGQKGILESALFPYNAQYNSMALQFLLTCSMFELLLKAQVELNSLKCLYKKRYRNVIHLKYYL